MGCSVFLFQVPERTFVHRHGESRLCVNDSPHPQRKHRDCVSEPSQHAGHNKSIAILTRYSTGTLHVASVDRVIWGQRSGTLQDCGCYGASAFRVLADTMDSTFHFTFVTLCCAGADLDVVGVDQGTVAALVPG